MNETRNPNERTWSEWWRLLNSTPWQDAIRGRLTGTLPASHGIRHWLRRGFRRPSNGVESILAESGLPEPIQSAVRRMVRVARIGRMRRAEFATELVRYLAKGFEVPPVGGALLNQPSDGGTTSLALPLPALEKLGDARICLVHSLPRSISQLIDDIVQRTRLWRRERIDVARELISHFEEGLLAGRSDAELAATFGEPRAVARLIRRAKLRQRPWAWRTSQRMLQAVGVFAAIIVVCWSWLLIRFLLATPTIKHDFVGEWDQRSQAIAEADRAWPLYRAALLKFQKWVFPTYVREDRDALLQALETGARSDHWPFWLKHLKNNREALELTLKGSEQRHLGFAYRDETNREWLESTGKGVFDRQQQSTNGIMVGVLLPHIQGLRDLYRLLVIEVEQARFERDRTRWLRAWSANLSLAEQLPPECAIIQTTAFHFASQSWSWLRTVLTDDSTWLADDDLRRLAHRIAAFQGGGRLRLKVERAFGDDLLQRFYTDDGHGDGRLTPEFFRLKEEVAKSFSQTSSSTRGPASVRALAEAARSGVVASRAEMRLALRQYYDLEESESAKPLWEQPFDEPSPGSRLLNQWQDSPWDRLRLEPFLAIFQPLVQSRGTGRIWQAAEFATQNRDATLVAIALTVYHRRHGQWPERLEQLCPDLLPEVPLDRFDGQPLRYRIVDGRPLLYSVGRNRIDEAGQRPTDKQDNPEAGDGDWQLWPTPRTTEPPPRSKDETR